MENVFEITAYHKQGYTDIWKATLSQVYSISEKDDLWLGKGIYFWEKYSDAEWWNGGYDNPTISLADLKCPEEYFLNLDSSDGLSDMQGFLDELEKKIALKTEKKIAFTPALDERTLCLCCNLYKKASNTLLMKYSFPKRSGRPQYCATDNSIVYNIRIAKAPKREG